MIQTPAAPPEPKMYIERIFKADVPIHHFFLNRIEDINIVFGQSQIENIYVTLSFIVGECMPHCRTPPLLNDMKDVSSIKGVESLDFPLIGKGRVADTPNQRHYYRVKIQNLVKSNIQKCIQWCIQHNLVYNY
jgi:hypothetical protein